MITKILFYKKALNSNGEPYDSVVMTYTIKGNISEDDAICKAIEEFKAHFKVSKWEDIADYYSII